MCLPRFAHRAQGVPTLAVAPAHPVAGRSVPRRQAAAALALSAACLAWAGWPGAALATPGEDEPPLPGTPPVLQVPELQEATLPNGLRLVVVPRPGLPLVTLALHLRNGSNTDPAGLPGLASMTHDLRTRGAVVQGRRLDATALAQRAEALGASLATSTHWLGSTLSVTVATPHLAAAADLLAGVIRHPTLPADELALLKQQAADGLKFRESDPMALAGLVAQRSFWGESGHGQAVSARSLAGLQLAQIQAQHARQARPDRATLVLAGDITLAQAQRLAQRVWGDWRAHGPRPADPVAQPPAPTLPATVLVNLPSSGQSGVVVMAPSVPLNSPERRVAQVAATVLGGGYSARLNTEVRIKRGLSYGANAGSSLQPEAGVLSASTQTNHPSAAEVVQVMKAEILRMAQDAPSAQELASRQAVLVNSFASQLDTTDGLASLALDLVSRQRPLSEVRDVAPSLQAVTAEQVRRFAQTHWQADQLRVVVVGDLAAAGAALTPPGAKVLSRAEALP